MARSAGAAASSTSHRGRPGRRRAIAAGRTPACASTACMPMPRLRRRARVAAPAGPAAGRSPRPSPCTRALRERPRSAPAVGSPARCVRPRAPARSVFLDPRGRAECPWPSLPISVSRRGGSRREVRQVFRFRSRARARPDRAPARRPLRDQPATAHNLSSVSESVSASEPRCRHPAISSSTGAQASRFRPPKPSAIFHAASSAGRSPLAHLVPAASCGIADSNRPRVPARSMARLQHFARFRFGLVLRHPTSARIFRTLCG